jgi:hypothetical protein
MSKILPLIACTLVLSGTAAVAQTNRVPFGPRIAPTGTNGVTPTPDVGANSHVRNNPDSTTTMEEQQIKQGRPMAEPGNGYSSGPRYENQTMRPPDQSHTRHPAAITDEYGFRYDSRGDRLDVNGNVVSPQNQ